jgi:hypothetical protein
MSTRIADLNERTVTRRLLDNSKYAFPLSSFGASMLELVTAAAAGSACESTLSLLFGCSSKGASMMIL